MRIGIVGAGMIGGTLARLFVGAGHEVTVSNSRGPATLRQMVEELGPRAHAATVDQAARFGEVVVLAVPWRTPQALPPAELLQGKVVVDAMNPYAEGGGMVELGESTSSEETRKRLPGARLVKAFNTIWYQHLGTRGRTDLPLDERHAVFVAGDDDEAKATVSRLIQEIGFAPIDTGGLRDGGRRQQPGTPLYNRILTGAEARALVNAAEG
ncbi:MAG: NADPH-dependent F420 reductase [Gemmatimonadetes bacterium]|nr:NADPH-dependent F420 reductase [Gemmatimonadota bacterium]